MSLPSLDDAIETRRHRVRHNEETTPRVFYYRKQVVENEPTDGLNKERFTEVRTTKVEPIKRSESFVLSDTLFFKKLLFPTVILACTLLPILLLSSLSPHTHPTHPHPIDDEFKTVVRDGLTNIKERLDNTVTRGELKEELDRERKERQAIREMIVDLRSEEFLTQEKLEKLIQKRLPSLDTDEIKKVVEETLKEKALQVIDPVVSEAQKKTIQSAVEDAYKQMKSDLEKSSQQNAQKLAHENANLNNFRGPELQRLIRETVHKELASTILPADDKEKLVEEIKRKFAGSLLSKDDANELIEQAMDKFAADQIALPDFALASAGAEIIHSKTSTRYFGKSWLSFMLMPFSISHPPSTILEPDVTVGKCWAFSGSQGNVTIHLSQPIQVESVTIDHIDHRIAHHVQSAPKTFQVWGFKHLDGKGALLGSYSFDVYSYARKTFPVHRVGVYRFITLEVTSNFGNPDYTCIYRFRVHGKPL